MKKTVLSLLLAVMSLAAFAQEFDHGNNKTYTPYHGFAVPVEQPTALHKPIELPLSNQEKDIITKPIKGANSGLHFPAGTPDVKTVRYDLYITDTTVNFTGKERKTIAVNGQWPGPTLSFTVGDTALVYVHNYSSEPTSVHWHGVQLPERMDGVSFLTQMPIPPKTVYVYKFPVVQAGTYWYHSHYMLQEQIGLYGSLIFNKRKEPEIPTIPVILSDWSDTSPEEIQRMLHTGNDWFGIKKHSTQSYWEALKAGKLGVKLTNEWKRMEAMDISDVYYEKFMINGDTTQHYTQFGPGDKVRLRIANGGASSYFWLNYSGGDLTVVANDGNDVVPVNVDRLIIGPSETYDVILTIPDDGQYQFVATAEDRSGYASMWFGKGKKYPQPKLPKLDYFAGMKMMNDMMKMNGDMAPMGMEMSLQTMDMNSVMYPELKNENVHNHHNSSENKSTYVCPMHPEVTSDQPGECPKCGMNLQPSKAAHEKHQSHKSHAGQHAKSVEQSGHHSSENKSTYVCPMHPEVTSDQPGECPKCGMNLQPAKASHDKHQNHKAQSGHHAKSVEQSGHHSSENKSTYVCPMHPDEVSNHPGECSKCGMTLQKKGETSAHQHHSHKGKGHSSSNTHQHSTESSEGIVTLNYNMLQSTKKSTELPKDGEWRTLKFELNGNMNRYVWSIDNKTVGESDKILIRKGENLRIVLYNNTMMRHPMHLHGHDFRVLNQYGKRSPMKNVLDIMPMESDTLEFHASESGDWFFHCHILYHMMGGMGRIFSYADSPQNPEMQGYEKHARHMLLMDEKRFYFSAENDFASNGSTGELSFDQTRWGVKAEWEIGYKDTDGYEVEAKFGRFFGHKQWLFPYVGAGWQYRKGTVGHENWFGQHFDQNNRVVARLGVQYTLPWLVVADASIDHTGHVLVQIEREDIPLSPRLRGAFMFNSDKEYRFGLQYIVFKNFSLTSNYSNHFGWGAGISVNY